MPNQMYYLVLLSCVFKLVLFVQTPLTNLILLTNNNQEYVYLGKIIESRFNIFIIDLEQKNNELELKNRKLEKQIYLLEDEKEHLLENIESHKKINGTESELESESESESQSDILVKQDYTLDKFINQLKLLMGELKSCIHDILFFMFIPTTVFFLLCYISTLK